MNVQKFARIAESLRQYQRAELKDFEEEIGARPVDAIYVDPLPNDAVLNSVLSSNTTFLLGRKGTGKSTVFARAQSIFRNRKDLLSTYIDVKSLYDIVNTAETPARIVESADIDAGICRAHLLRKAFLGAVISELLKEVDRLCSEMSLWDIWRGKKKSFVDLRGELSNLQSRVREVKLTEHELPILQEINRSWKSRLQMEHSEGANAGLKGEVSVTGVKAGTHASVSDFEKSLDDSEVYNQYSDVVLKSFPFEEIISELRDLLDESSLKRLVVFFDDFSELNFLDQRLFVDVVLAPLNNSSNEAVKLKIAGYPGRVYYGRIDATKVDTFSLDFSALYEATEVQTMERAAIDYATRLLDTRFKAFGENMSAYFDPSVPMDEHMKLMFQTTFNVPRLMGSLLHICYLDRVSRGLQVNAASLRLAARKYYESTIMQYFQRMNRFALEPFENKLDRHNQEQLLRYIVKEARDVRRRISDGSVGGTYFQGLSNPPTSHFVISSAIGDVFKSLESNFLLSKYKDTRDKDGRAVAVYALFYGLAEFERLAWGYPPGREYRNYFVQRCFDFTAAIHEFLSRNQTIRCSNCGKCYPLEQRGSFELYKWRCPECRDGICAVVNLADDFRAEVAELRDDLMLESVELDILNTLDSEGRPMRAGEISAFIDVTYQLVGHRTSKLRDAGLVQKQPSSQDGKMRSTITDRARRTYFPTTGDAEPRAAGDGGPRA
ncbi:winged helix DNA-binding protein [Desulfoferrobacter suflitae]|uniref:winged helix DNA-binding protein n=1 Tax=Desulfoferrobacter suflitae TaxID=2865782 RepID=UPI002164EEEA|nr:winged helix DNA-binding protein [Desulfoferrobacter suflitae]MCK8600069.1 winged helix DNA-binding protein [Desulfoferrobacter suflitae]